MTSSAIWTPSLSRIADSNMQDFLLQANSLFQQQGSNKQQDSAAELTNYSQLHQWSIDEPGLFWSLVWQYSELVPTLERPITDSEQLKQILKPGKEFFDSQWFSQLTMNFAENLLQRRDDAIALISCGEPSLNQGQDRSLSYQALYAQVAKLAHSLKAMGVVQGDRIAAFMPNTQETVIAMLATTSIGAIWSSCSPDFGLQGVIDRFGQIEPKILFTSDGYFYGGKTLDSLTKVEKIVHQLSSLEQVIVIPHIGLGQANEIDASNLADAAVSTWQQVLNNDCEEIEFNRLPFNHPLYIMYSSGTTGVPKCIVHSAGGTLIQHAKELRLHTDVKPDDTIFYYSTCGWMMWNWLVSSLSIGATVVLYDGSPFYPNGHCLWQMAEKHKVSIFGTSAKYLAALEKADIKPKDDYDLSPLKALLSTGSPLSHESFDYVYRDIKQDVCLSSISGGTDIISCFALGNPILPVFRGELQCLGLGMAVDIFDDQQQSLQQEKGELVCTLPFPSCPIKFWQDPENNKFKQAYFDQFEHPFEPTWAHGDYGEITQHGGLIIHGRSDAVLNPGGVRIGTAE
ncbi:acetoacetate--CoA ligase, partial [Oleispira antarctica]